MDALTYDLQRVLPFMQQRIVGMRRSDDMVGMGLVRDGVLVAGQLFEGYNGRNIWGHAAGAEDVHWCTRGWLAACFAYPFLVCKVDRLSAYVNASNTAARRFDEHVGFREEARLKGAAPDGGDVIVYVMWRQECRYIKS